MPDGRRCPGRRSTYGICMGVLSWLVHEGHADGVDLGGLAAAFVIRYDDDEPGSPWSFVVHVDERGTEEQRRALADILTGRLGGDDILRLPWVRKPSEELAVRASAIELRVGGDRNELRVGSAVDLAATQPFPTEERVSCVIRATTSPAPSTTPTISSSGTTPSSGSSRGTAPTSARSPIRADAEQHRLPELRLRRAIGLARLRPRDAGDVEPRRVRSARGRAPDPRAARAALAAGNVLRPGTPSSRSRPRPSRSSPPATRSPTTPTRTSIRVGRAPPTSGPTWSGPGRCSSGSACSRAASARPRPISRR